MTTTAMGGQWSTERTDALQETLPALDPPVSMMDLISRLINGALTRCRGIPLHRSILIAVFSIIGAALTTAVLNRWTGWPTDDYPFMLKYIVILLITVFLGAIPGLVAGATAMAMVAVSHMPPVGNILIYDHVHRAGLASLGLYVVALAGTVGVLHRTMDRLKRSEELRNLLFMEFRHRSRNDLNGLYAMLVMRSKDVRDPTARSHMLSAANHAMTLAKLYKRLESHHLKGGMVTVNTHEFVKGIMADIIGTQEHRAPVHFSVLAENHQLGFERAIQLGLILNEMVTNSIKYAFPDGRNGWICVRLHLKGPDLVLVVEDDGVGMEASAGREKDPTTSSGLGTRLINGLARQLGGTLTRASKDGESTGTTAVLTFPLNR